MPTVLVSFFGFVQANYGQIAAAVLMLTLLGSFLNWIAGLLAGAGWTKWAHVFAGGGSLIGDAVRALGWLISLLYSIFGQTPPPMARRMMRGPFDNYADGGITVLGKKPNDSLNANDPADSGRFSRVAIGGLIAAALAAMILACTPAQVTDAVQTVQSGLQEEACVQNYVEHATDPTYEGAALACAGVMVDLAEQIIQDIRDAHKAPASDSGLMKVEAPTQFELQLSKVHHADGAK